MNGELEHVYSYEPLAQLAEHFTFNERVWSSNLQWLTTSSRTLYRSRRLFYKKSPLTRFIAPYFSAKYHARLVCSVVAPKRRLRPHDGSPSLPTFCKSRLRAFLVGVFSPRTLFKLAAIFKAIIAQ